jgi:hypothetical protein
LALERLEVPSLFNGYEVKLLRVRTGRGSEYCGNPERHERELYLAIEDIVSTRPRSMNFAAFPQKGVRSIDELRAHQDLGGPALQHGS